MPSTDRVDEDRGVDLVQGPGGPGLHLLDHLVGDPRDRLPRDARAVDLLEVRRDLPGRQPAGIQREHDLVDLTQPALSLLHDDRFEGALAVPGDLELDLPGRMGQYRLRPGPVPHVGRVPVSDRTVLLMAQVLGHLLVQRRLQHVLGELLEQPIRPGQRQPLLLREPDQLPGGDLLS
jgi:hypothetical protein